MSQIVKENDEFGMVYELPIPCRD